MTLNLTIELSEEQLNSLLKNRKLSLVIKPKDEGFVSSVLTDWPDCRGFKPAISLVQTLRMQNFDINDLSKLSKNRVQRLAKIYDDDQDSLLRIESIFNLSFSGPFHRYQTELSPIFGSYIANTLANIGICTETDLLTTNTAELIKSYHFGKKSFKEVTEYLAKKGYTLN